MRASLKFFLLLFSVAPLYGQTCTVSATGVRFLQSGGSNTVNAPGCAGVSSSVPWLTALLSAGQVTITASANATAATRFGFVTVGGRRITVSQLGTNAAAATASVVGGVRTIPVETPSFAPLLPARVSDVLISISPLNFPTSAKAEITAKFNGRVAPDAIVGSETTSLLLANGAGETPANPIQLGVNAFVAKLLDPDSIRWSGIPVGTLQTSATGGILRLKLSRLRTNGTTVAVDLQTSAAIGLTNANTALTVATRNAAGMTTLVGTPTAGPVANSFFIPITLTETTPKVFAPTEGASPGTRILVNAFFPTGTYAQVSSTNNNAQLVSADFSGFGGDYVTGQAIFGGQFSLVNDAPLTWQVKTANDSAVETLVLRLLVTNSTIGNAQSLANNIFVEVGPQYGEIVPISGSDFEVLVDNITVVGSNQRISFRLSNTEEPDPFNLAVPAVVRGNSGPGYSYAACTRSDGQTCSFSGDTLDTAIPDVPGGTSITFTVDLAPTADTPDGTYVESSFEAISQVSEDDLSDNLGTAGFIKQACAPLAPATGSFSAAGGNGTVNVPNCFLWSASSQVSWLTVTSPANNFAPGQVQYTAAPYTGAANRTGSLVIVGNTYNVTQKAACVHTLSPVGQTIAGTGGGTNFSLTTGQDCEWTISSDAAWLSTPTPTGLNSKVVSTVAVANDTLAQRIGRLTVREPGLTGGSSATFTVTQQPGPPCSLSLSTASVVAASGAGSATFNVIATGAGCSWSLSDNADWLQLSPASGTASATITYTATANPSINSRSATVQLLRTGVATPAATLTLTQSGNTCVTLSAVPTPAPHTGQSGPITVTAAGTCSWTAASTATWLQVFPLAGTGSGTVTYKLYPNFGTTTRTATITIGGRLIQISQSGNAAEVVLRRFIRLLYFSFLGRAAGDNEVQAWIGTAASRGLIARSFLNSPEFNLGGRFAAGLYVGLLNRDPEFTGWQFQRDAVREGAIQSCALVSNFIGSAEFSQQHPGIADDAYIRLLYRQILLREASNPEVTFHQGTLPVLGRAGIACNFLNTVEFRQGTGPRLTAFLLYATLLLRDGSDSEKTALAGVLRNNPGALDSLLDLFANSGEIGILLE